jgi:tetratricopeptide (TPR) repeat protein
MNTQLEIIKSKLERYEEFRATESERVKNEPNVPSSGAEHIFYDLIRFLVADDKEMEVRLFYYFHSYQECLTFCRARSFTLAEEKLAFIEAYLPLDMHPKTVLGMEAVFYPMKAFYLLKVKQQYQAAVEALEKSIARFECLAIGQFTEADDAMLEQELNICRVYFEAGKPEEAIRAVRTLCAHLDRNFIRDTKSMDGEALHYYINSLLRTCLQAEAGIMISLFAEIIRCFLSMDICRAGLAPAYFRLLEAWVEKREEKFIFILSNEIETFFRSPPMVQLVLIINLIVLTAGSDYPEKMQLCDEAARYSKKVIRIEPDRFHKILSVMLKHQHVLK